jgi:rod shape-determining protein MreC
VVSRGGITGTMQSLRLAKGSLSGIRRGDAVVVPDGVVGRVVEVSLHTSEVMLITDPNSRVACEIEQPEIPLGSVRGILYGGGTRIAAESSLRLLYVVEPLRLRYLGREFEPPVRARIVTSGLGETFPGGLTVGYLLESSLDAGELTREAEIMPAVELSSVEDVFVLSRNRRSHAQ